MQIKVIPTIQRKSTNLTQPSQKMGNPAFGKFGYITEASEIVIPKIPPNSSSISIETLNLINNLVDSATVGKLETKNLKAMDALDALYKAIPEKWRKVLEDAYMQLKRTPPKTIIA